MQKTTLCVLLFYTTLLFQNCTFLHVVLIPKSSFSQNTQNYPEFPIRNIDTRTIQKINDQYQTTTPHFPIHDLTNDGRIGVLKSLKKTDEGDALPFMVIKPERVNIHLKHPTNSKVGANLISGAPYTDFNLIRVLKRTFQRELTGYHSPRTVFCEKTEQYQNPFVCNDGVSDCYKLTLVTRHTKPSASEVKVRFSSLDVLVKIKNPKTTRASIEFIREIRNTKKIGPALTTPKGFVEPFVAGDGRLIVGRVFGMTTELTSGATTGPVNMVYSVYPEKGAQCDASKWRNILPISHAHYDRVNNMRQRYKFARYPLRDGLGRIVPNGHDLGGSYPWIDKHAANLFFWSTGYDRYYNNLNGFIQGLYPERPSDQYYTSAEDGHDIKEFEYGSVTSGLAMAGFWTHGKTVLFDGSINNANLQNRN